jgi:hypothetical protein
MFRSSPVARPNPPHPSFQGALQETLQGTLQGTLQETFQGTLKGTLQETIQKTFQETLQGSLQGILPSLQRTSRGPPAVVLRWFSPGLPTPFGEEEIERERGIRRMKVWLRARQWDILPQEELFCDSFFLISASATNCFPKLRNSEIPNCEIIKPVIGNTNLAEQHLLLKILDIPAFQCCFTLRTPTRHTILEKCLVLCYRRTNVLRHASYGNRNPKPYTLKTPNPKP